MEKFDRNHVIETARLRRERLLAEHRSGKSVRVLGDELGLSYQRVSSILARARRDERDAAAQ